MKNLPDQSKPLKNPIEDKNRLRKNNLKVEIAPRSPDIDARWTQVKIAGKNIHPRSYHTCCVYQHKLYVYGGYEVDFGILGDFQMLDLATPQGGFKWTWLSSKKDNYPGKLRSHTAVIHDNQMYIFGGQKNLGQNSNITYVYSFQTESWRIIRPSKDTPTLDSHSACVYKNLMIVYGGFISSQAKHSQNVYALDLTTQTWSIMHKPAKGEASPVPRSCFGMIGCENVIWVFGGTDGNKTLNDFWKFDIQSKKWTPIVNISNTHPPEVNELLTKPRRNTTLTAFENNLFIFGGIQDVTKQKNDIYVYDIATSRWSKIHSSTNSIYECSPTLKKNTKNTNTIEKRDRKSSSPLRSQGLMSLKSGDSPGREKDKSKHTKEDQSQIMKKIIQQTRQKKFIQKKRQMLKEFEEAHEKTRPGRRLSPTSENMKKTLEVIGDQQFNMEPLNHQVRYDETGRFILGKKPCARDAHSAVIHDSKLLIFGGDRHLMSFCDLYSFDLVKGLQSKAFYDHP